MERINVVGTTGSGKTTFAAALAPRLGLPHVELDALHWGPNWTEAPLEVFRARVAAVVERDAWVIDGNYGKSRDLVLARADTVVWLDYPFLLTFSRLLRRTLRRTLRGEELWNGNRERLGNAVFSRDSILLWQLKTYWRRRREYPRLFARPEYAHLDVHRLVLPGQARAWLDRAGTLRPPRP